MFSTMRKILFPSIIAILLSSSISACTNSGKTHISMMALEEMPPDVVASPMRVQTAYRFAAANPDVLEEIPCYCGCDSIGHESNYDCYVASVESSGLIIFDKHAINCSICVDITQDVANVLKDGKSPQDAKAYILMAYSKYAPSNLP